MNTDHSALAFDIAEEWRNMERRLEAHAAAGGCDFGPETLTIDASVYTDPVRFDAERIHLFQRTPLLICLSVDLPEMGSVRPFDIAGVPIILVRAASGAVRGYLNMCMHRGVRLANSCGRSQVLTCPFHAWSYNLDGELVNVPQAKAFAEADIKARRLIEIPVAEWHGMIFVRLQPGGEPIDVAQHLGPIAPLFRAFDLAAAKPVKTEQFAVSTNWKLALGTFCEAYHIPVVHAKTLAPQLISYVTVQDEFDRHSRYANPSIKFAECVGKPEADWPRSNYNAVHYLYPNTIVVYSDAIDGNTPLYALFSMFPGAGVGESTVLASTYRPASAECAERVFADTHDFSLNLIKHEDLQLVVELWRNLQAAPSGHRLLFGRNEWLLQRYHRRIAADIGMPLP